MSSPFLTPTWIKGNQNARPAVEDTQYHDALTSVTTSTYPCPYSSPKVVPPERVTPPLPISHRNPLTWWRVFFPLTAPSPTPELRQQDGSRSSASSSSAAGQTTETPSSRPLPSPRRRPSSLRGKDGRSSQEAGEEDPSGSSSHSSRRDSEGFKDYRRGEGHTSCTADTTRTLDGRDLGGDQKVVAGLSFSSSLLGKGEGTQTEWTRDAWELQIQEHGLIRRQILHLCTCIGLLGTFSILAAMLSQNSSTLHVTPRTETDRTRTRTGKRGARKSSRNHPVKPKPRGINKFKNSQVLLGNLPHHAKLARALQHRRAKQRLQTRWNRYSHMKIRHLPK
jgi:hypothetical protein